jgi:hypothetical protein
MEKINNSPNMIQDIDTILSVLSERIATGQKIKASLSNAHTLSDFNQYENLYSEWDDENLKIVNNYCNNFLNIYEDGFSSDIMTNDINLSIERLGEKLDKKMLKLVEIQGKHGR